jgi:glycosyltransferase involved in cell wall biosynthesis
MKLKIAHLTSRMLPAIGGAEVCLHNIAQRQIQAGHEVVVICPEEMANVPTGDYIKEPLPRGTLFLLNKSFGLGRMRLNFTLSALHRRYDFDLWQVTIGYPLGAAAVDFFKKRNIPCILRCTGFDVQRYEDIDYGVRLNVRIEELLRKKYSRYDKLVAISNAMREEYSQLSVPEDKIVKIPNGVDWQRFQDYGDHALVRNRLGLGGDEKLILTVGRHHPKKGFHLIPKIVKELSKKRGNFQWLIVGDDVGEIMALAKKEGVGRFIRTRPAVEQPKDDFAFPADGLIGLYRSADVFAFPTFIETFGIVVVEAMAAGLPVVTTTAPGVDELIEHEQSGLKSEPGDVEAMAVHLDRVLADEDLSAGFSRNAIEVSRRFDWDAVAEHYEDLYVQLSRQKNDAKESNHDRKD